jgi:hypothetical protein
MACEIVWHPKGILFIHSGTVTNEEVENANGIMYGDPRFERIEYQISDYLSVTNNLLTPVDAKVIGTLDSVSSHWNRRKMKIAVVSTDENFFPVIESYFRVITSRAGWEGRVFKTREEAFQWVGFSSAAENPLLQN